MLNNAEDELREMAGTFAHEINNPLAVITGCLEQLHELVMPQMTGMERQNADSLFVKIQGTVDRMVKIVRGLRNMSRIGEGNVFQPVSLRTIMDEVLELCDERLKSHNVRVTSNISPANLELDCCSIQIAEVFLNLIVNADDAIAELEEKWIRIEAEDTDGGLQISVTDSGRGIPAEEADHIFAPFYSTKSASRGAGLGLSIAKRIVHAHNGVIQLDRACSNTKFVILFPKR
jgi:signal transduction histidine kinase